LQVPNNETWKNCENEVGSHGENTVESRKRDNNIWADACAILALIPKERHGMALENSDEKENCA
jgi:hypothetical protein